MSETPTPAAVEDPFRLGWRYVREVGPNGEETVRQVPLTERDLLFPQEEDFVANRDPHTRDMLYLREAIRTVLRDRPAVHVFADHRIDFNLPGVEPLGPDVAVIDGIGEWDGTRGTLYLAEQGRPLLVVEVTSPDTRRNDFGIKREFYARAGVPVYVIVEHQAEPRRDGVALHVLRLDGQGAYAELPSNEQGRVRLPQLRLSLGIEDRAVWVYDRTGRRLEEGPRLVEMIEEAERQAQELADRQAQMEVQLEQEIDLRHQASAARQQAEAARQQAEADRKRAEDDLAREREANRNLQQRLRDLEEQLRRSPPET